MTPEEIFNATHEIDDNLQAMLKIGSVCFVGLNLTSEPDHHTNMIIGATLLAMLSVSLMLKSYQKGYEHGLRDNPESLLVLTENLQDQVEELKAELELKEGIYSALSQMDASQDLNSEVSFRP